MNNQAAQTMPLPPSLPEWSRMDDLGGVVPSEVRQALIAMYQQGHAAALSQTAGVVLARGWFHALPDEDDYEFYDDASGAGKNCDGCIRAVIVAAPAASGGEPPSAASVSERARELLAKEYRGHGWHEDAGRLCMGGDVTSFVEDDALRVIARLIEEGDEDTHVITEMGRLLAAIAITLKGPEPAGTAWSYHDLPELVASALSEPRQVAAEMKAWAHTKMAEQQSSRRDRMMVSEWAKRLLPESSFPVKDFDVEGMSITKEAAREAVKRVALEQALTQQRGEIAAWQMRSRYWEGAPWSEWRTYPSHEAREADWVPYKDSEWLRETRELYTTPQPGAEALREDSARLDWIESQVQQHGDGYNEPHQAGWFLEWEQERPGQVWLGLRAWIDEERRRASGDELESLLGRGG
jgi:hypothetical protein